MNTKQSTHLLFVQTELGANPLANSGIELKAFDGLSTLYVGLAEAKLTAVPKGRMSLTLCSSDCITKMSKLSASSALSLCC